VKPITRLCALAATLFVVPSGSCAGVGRDERQLEDVVALLGVDPGDRIAQVGVGDGYLTSRLAEAAGPSGRVLATDLDDDAIDALERAVRDGRRFDLVLVYDRYRAIADRRAWFERLLEFLAPNGRVAIVEPGGREGPAFAETIAGEMREAGFEPRGRYDALPGASFQIFRADDGTGE
jgi:ubiquinone/menaquinone biosynthesis C-methylase UbiE